MVETDDRDPLETQELRRLIAPVTSDNLVALVDQNGRIETECVDASRDRPHLDPAMLARIARISAQGADRNERQSSDAFGAFGLPFISPSPRLASIAQPLSFAPGRAELPRLSDLGRAIGSSAKVPRPTNLAARLGK
jgi:hypothetical protein